MSDKKPSRNAPCPCGSGKKYKHSCLPNEAPAESGPQYPVGTVAMYGPDDRTATKIAAGVIVHDGAEPIMNRWVATDVMTNARVQQELKDFFLQHGVKQVAMTEGNVGCPQNQGVERHPRHPRRRTPLLFRRADVGPAYASPPRGVRFA